MRKAKKKAITAKKGFQGLRAVRYLHMVSNSRPSDYETDALPTELGPQFEVVEAGWRSNLSHPI